MNWFVFSMFAVFAVVFAILSDTDSKWFSIPSAFCVCVAFISLLFL